MGEEHILFGKEDGIGAITINRPEKLNAFTLDMEISFFKLLADIADDDDVRVVIITGTGKAWCAGADVSVLGSGGQRTDGSPQEAGAATRRKEKEEEMVRQAARSGQADGPLPRWPIAGIPKPTIAAMNGPAVGMGAEFAAACDIRIATENAKFGWVFGRLGLTPDIGVGPTILPHLVGFSKALELMYTGRVIDAIEAEKIGLVDQLVSEDELMPAATAMAARISQSSPLALRGVKELTYGALEWPPSVHQGETWKRFLQSNRSEDVKEGIRAFVEKRKPVWKGR